MRRLSSIVIPIIEMNRILINVASNISLYKTLENRFNKSRALIGLGPFSKSGQKS